MTRPRAECGMDDDGGLWADCPAGALVAMVQASRTARRQRHIGRMAGPTIGLLLVLLWTGFVITRSPVDQISCADVIDRFFEFSDNQLDSELSGRISLHLDKCPECRHRYAMLLSGEDSR
ncbi:MAG: hypothetical protein QGG36_25265 [Pirellulaceae bacterium]|nr:hypothetical protein [Pirellulaceae bacterium]